MSVQSQIDRIEQNVANTYAALAALGADMPSEQNSDNLATTAGTAKAVLYSEQELTPEQQAQARQNIGADDFATFTESEFAAFTQEELATKYGDGVRILAIAEDENLVPAAISKNRVVYNGCGYMKDYRLNSSGGVQEAQSAVVTGFIPYTHSKTIEIGGGLNPASAGGQYIATYNGNFELIGVNYLSTLIANSGGTSVQTESNEYIHTVKTASFGSADNTNMFKTATYIRISLCPCIGSRLSVRYI
jgi:hypothetical protein